MADTTIANLTALTTIASGDLIPVTDISDTTDSSGGTTKKITFQNLVGLWIKETPSGSHNGTNLTYTLTHTPMSSSFRLIVNGQEFTEGTDYSVSGTTLSLTTALPKNYTGSFIAHYQYRT